MNTTMTRRQQFEAKFIEQGLTPEQAREMAAYWAGSASEGPVKDRLAAQELDDAEHEYAWHLQHGALADAIEAGLALKALRGQRG